MAIVLWTKERPRSHASLVHSEMMRPRAALRKYTFSPVGCAGGVRSSYTTGFVGEFIILCGRPVFESVSTSRAHSTENPARGSGTPEVCRLRIVGISNNNNNNNDCERSVNKRKGQSLRRERII